MRRIALLMAVSMVAGACIDAGSPPLDEQMKALGLPLEWMLVVNDETKVTMQIRDGKPELLIFKPGSFGGWQPYAWPAERPTINGGSVGRAQSLGPGTNAGFDPGFNYVFGAGQGPILNVQSESPGARARVVNPEIGGWVIVVPEEIEVEAVDWELIGADRAVLYVGRGVGPR